ncbi:MAG: chromosome segregation protein SMC [Pseudomonadota bacterium]
MKFTNLRLIGFKSFVDTTDLDIRDGLTGIVGPNGCGKSNLLEALRWVMGATSAKALRGGGMSDVVFAGSAMRPARNWAEVILTLDNSDRTAPAEYNDTETLEISRRIVKNDDGAQSIYRINSKEVRAKDVQLLFADASTGANSPALVRQGQISELINAKPQNRRRLLEEAAGVTGLHSRRHEAELRLRAAEQNLSRLDDVIGELESQKTTLSRQARQATRYKNVSRDIRRTEAGVAYLRWREAVAARDEAMAAFDEVGTLVEETARVAAAAGVAQAAAHEKLDPLRQAEAETAAGLHRLTVAREGLDSEAERAASELAKITADLESYTKDRQREEELRNDAIEAIAALERETEGLGEREDHEKSRIEEAERTLNDASDILKSAEQRFDEKNAEITEIEAERRALQASEEASQRRIEKIALSVKALLDERDRLVPSDEQAATLEAAKSALTESEQNLAAADVAFHESEVARAGAEDNERRLAKPKDDARKAYSELKAECDALERILGAQADGHWPGVIESIEATSGYETALAAALGDDLDAALDSEAPAYWASQQGTDFSASETGTSLPFGAEPLSRFVNAPEVLARRLAMVGVVESENGAELATALKPGQRLVTRNGDLWRWDGFVKRAEAKTAAAIRLEQRNRLTGLIEGLEQTRLHAEETVSAHEKCLEILRESQSAERDARNTLSAARKAVDAARNDLASIEKQHERATARLSAIADTLEAATSEKAETEQTRTDAREALSRLPNAAAGAQALALSREALSKARTTETEARAAFRDLTRDAEMRASRRQELAREIGVWKTRGESAAQRINDLVERLDALSAAKAEAENAPLAIEEKRKSLLNQLGDAEERRRTAADALATAVNEAQVADQTVKQAEAAASDAREGRARLDAQAESAVARVEEATSLAHETCSCAPEELTEIAEFKDDANPPERGDLERKLERYKRERENLGGVNLRADEELEEVTERLTEIGAEREDCEAAIRKLRAAIGSINREARERLNAAFETVNTNFSTLFTRLFNGGQAELRMIESEDVLEAGLEVFASPPGKKLASMSLMSGGEQALTATALIFAVFMANPAPVCVLDEVDAPLDDANTERFCRLLHQMASETKTRFLVITHHALSMSRMNRLFGVTMMERGVSQLVSVDLNAAEELVAAE